MKNRPTRLISGCMKEQTASLSLYEDTGEGNAYRSGQYATISITLHGHILHIGKRMGAFPNMLVQRTFRVWTLGKSQPTSVRYNGQAQEVSLTPGR